MRDKNRSERNNSICSKNEMAQLLIPDYDFKYSAVYTDIGNMIAEYDGSRYQKIEIWKKIKFCDVFYPFN